MSKELQHNRYSEILRHIIAEIKSTHVTLARRVNNSMITMYWNIGKP